MLTYCESLEPRRLLDGGETDASFGDEGRIERQRPDQADLRGFDLDTFPQGQVLITTSAVIGPGNDDQRPVVIDLWRTRADGSPDPHFGDPATGLVTITVPEDLIVRDTSIFTPFPQSEVTPDDGIVTAAGYRLFKTRSNGSPDRSFGQRGQLAVTEFEPREQMAMDADAQGRIYVSGALADGGDLAVLRFNPDGSRDATFGTNGLVQVAPAGQIEERLSAVRALDDGKIQIACHAESQQPPGEFSFPVGDMVSVRLDETGRLDQSFGQSGVVRREGPFSNDLTGRDLGLPTVGSNGSAMFVQGERERDLGSFSIDTIVGIDPAGGAIDVPAGEDERFTLIEQIVVEPGFRGIIKSNVVTFLDANFATIEQPTAAAEASIGPIQEFDARRLTVAPDGTLLVLGTHQETATTTLLVHRLFPHDSPVAQLDARVLRAPRTGSYRFALTWRDDDGVDTDSLGNDDVTVLMPGGVARRARLMNIAGADGATSVTAIYALTAPDGAWDAADNGRYRVRVNSRAVRDVDGNAAERRVIGAFDISIRPIVQQSGGDANNDDDDDDLPANG